MVEDISWVEADRDAWLGVGTIEGVGFVCYVDLLTGLRGAWEIGSPLNGNGALEVNALKPPICPKPA